MVNKLVLFFIAITTIIGCDSTTKLPQKQIATIDSSIISVNEDPIIQGVVSEEPEIIEDTAFVDIENIIEDIELDFVYADTANFLKTAVYPCEQCLLRYEVALALKDVSIYLDSLGYKLQLMDCYRSFSVQEFMWKVLPDSRYVANPNNGGSIHNRGGAVDLRLLYSSNNDTVPMGTKFDHFGVEAAHTYTNLPQSVLDNRLILKNAMARFGFDSLKTEWWHYTYKNARTYPIAKVSFNCD